MKGKSPMTAQELSYYAGILLSLIFSYVPGIEDKYKLLDGVYKRLVMLLLLIITTGGIFALACWSVTAEFIPITCDPVGLKTLVTAFIGALIANQAVFLISPKKRS
jgi:ABC-type transport system involved in cytochrome c biogenesis permease subunit